jgi:hypothetical protein
MASHTSHDKPAPPAMRPTPGVSPEQHDPNDPNARPGPFDPHLAATPRDPTDPNVAPSLDPVLVDGIDPVYLARLYPDEFAQDGAKGARDAALAVGRAGVEAGRKLSAAQQDKPQSPPEPGSGVTITPKDKHE